MKKSLKIVILLLIFTLISSVILWQFVISPQYSLWKIKIALKNHDLISFRKHVQLDGMVDHMIDQAWQNNSDKRDHFSQLPALGQEIGERVLEIFKPNLKELIKGEIIRYVKTGQWIANSEDNMRMSDYIINNFKEKIDPTKKIFQSINYIQRNSENAFLGLTFCDQSYQTNVIVELKMINMGGYWQLLEITNFKQLVAINAYLSGN
mgnify:CR=1 FL=1